MSSTPLLTTLLVPSTSSLMIHPASDSGFRSFVVGFSALWVPPKPITNLVVNTDSTVEFNLCSSVAPPVIQDAMDFSTSTSHRIHHTIGYKTDSVEKKNFTAPLHEADEIGRLEKQVKEGEVEFSQLRKPLNLLRNRCEQLLKDNDLLTRDVYQGTTHLKEIKDDKEVTRANERSLECLSAKFRSFAENKF